MTPTIPQVSSGIDLLPLKARPVAHATSANFRKTLERAEPAKESTRPDKRLHASVGEPSQTRPHAPRELRSRDASKPVRETAPSARRSPDSENDRAQQPSLADPSVVQSPGSPPPTAREQETAAVALHGAENADPDAAATADPNQKNAHRVIQIEKSFASSSPSVQEAASNDAVQARAEKPPTGQQGSALQGQSAHQNNHADKNWLAATALMNSAGLVSASNAETPETPEIADTFADSNALESTEAPDTSAVPEILAIPGIPGVAGQALEAAIDGDWLKSPNAKSPTPSEPDPRSAAQPTTASGKTKPAEAKTPQPAVAQMPVHQPIEDQPTRAQTESELDQKEGKARTASSKIPFQATHQNDSVSDNKAPPNTTPIAQGADQPGSQKVAVDRAHAMTQTLKTDESAQAGPGDETGVNLARVIRGLGGAVQHKGGAVTIRLTPPEMGVVRVRMTIEHGFVRAQIEAETEPARQLLTQQIGQLRQALHGHGLGVEKLEVQSMPQGSSSQDTGSDRNPADRGNANAGDGRSRGFLGHQDQPQQGGDHATADGQDRAFWKKWGHALRGFGDVLRSLE